MKFTVWKVGNGWIVLVGDHDRIELVDMPNVRVFSNTALMAGWMSARSQQRK